MDKAPSVLDLSELTEADWLDRVTIAGPLVEAEAPEADRARRLTATQMDALHDQALFRLLLPSAYGGAEVRLPTLMTIVEAIATYDASAAWCIAQGNACASLSGFLDPDLAQEMFGRDLKGVLAWGPGKAVARATEGGYRVTADTGFASGSHHATWVAAHCRVEEADGSPRLGANGQPENRSALIPVGQVEQGDSWDVLGLRGTGSDGFVCEDLFVPENHTIVRATMIEDRPKVSSLHGMPLMTVYATAFPAIALGVARAVIDAFTRLAKDKKPRGARLALIDNPAVFEELARAEAKVQSSRAFLLAAAEAGAADLEGPGRMSEEATMRIRLAGTHAIHEAKAAVDLLFDTAGTSAIMMASPFERRFRDIHAVALQIQGRKAHFQTYGAWALGVGVASDGVTIS